MPAKQLYDRNYPFERQAVAPGPLSDRVLQYPVCTPVTLRAVCMCSYWAMSLSLGVHHGSELESFERKFLYKFQPF